MYAMEYSKQERAAPAAIAIVVHLALIYVFAAGMGVVPSPLPLKPLGVVDVPPDKIKPQPIEAIPIEPSGEKSDPGLFVPKDAPVINIDETRDPLVGLVKPPIESGGETAIEEPVIGARILSSTEPTYPLVSRAREEEGTVYVKVMISPYGTVGDVQIEKSSGYSRLDEAAMKAVREWKFSAGKRGSEAIATWVTVSVKFVLHGRR